MLGGMGWFLSPENLEMKPRIMQCLVERNFKQYGNTGMEQHEHPATTTLQI